MNIGSQNLQHRVGGWLPSSSTNVPVFLQAIISEAERTKSPLAPSVKSLEKLIESDAAIYQLVNQMIDEVPKSGKYARNPIGGVQIRDYHQMLKMINVVLSKPPEYNDTELVGFPINAILDWSMGTPSGNAFFLEPRVNACFKEILNAWGKFLKSGKSRKVLNKTQTGWMNKEAAAKLNIKQFVHDSKKPHWGFKSWNDFFTRKFKKGERPIAEPKNNKVIVSGCESTPFAINRNVQKYSEFWLKGQPYSLQLMLNNSEHVDDFVGGTVYQAFLSAMNYHRWNSPVTGKIKHVEIVDGSYYAEAISEGFDPGGPNLSQGYIAQVATRALIFIEADDPVIGLMCMIPIGMSEVSSCVVTVEEGDHVEKGDELGMFQFGGSTHCMVFRPGVISEFSVDAIPGPNAGIVKLGSKVAIAN